MITYSVTVTVDLDVQTKWLEWMLTNHIPQVLKTGYFSTCNLLQVVEPAPEQNKIVFNVRYECDTLDAYRNYREREAPRLQAEHEKAFEGMFTIRRELLLPLKQPFAQVIKD